MIFLIGGTGLVGSGFVRYFKTKKIHFKLITRKNKKKFYGKKCNLLIDCNGNGSKRIGIKDPLFDFNASVLSVVENLTKIKFKKYIYISTAQVYESVKNKSLTKEDCSIKYKNINNYGFNKYIAELYIKKYTLNYLIFRLPYVLGPGLKRNPFHDIPNKKKTYLTLSSNINCIHTDTIAKLIIQINKNNNKKTFNLGSKNNIKVRDILKICNIKINELKKTKKTFDYNKINFEKIKKIIQLPNSRSEALKYLIKN